MACLVAAVPASAAKEQRHEPLPAEVVKAWHKAGASFFWLGACRFGIPEIRFIDLGKGEEPGEGKSGEVSVFWFTNWPTGGVAELPRPARAFGLALQTSNVMDGNLKELVALTTLQVLDLSRTHVTNAGLKDLTGLKNLQTLYLNFTEVTNAGLKDLAGLKNLQSLGLEGTTATDAGLKELAGLKSLQELQLHDTKVTDAGVKELQKALPALFIYPSAAEMSRRKMGR